MVVMMMGRRWWWRRRRWWRWRRWWWRCWQRRRRWWWWWWWDDDDEDDNDDNDDDDDDDDEDDDDDDDDDVHHSLLMRHFDLQESRANSEEFPTSFIQGWYQGMWWAVITMTTVGWVTFDTLHAYEKPCERVVWANSKHSLQSKSNIARITQTISLFTPRPGTAINPHARFTAGCSLCCGFSWAWCWSQSWPRQPAVPWTPVRLWTVFSVAWRWVVHVQHKYSGKQSRAWKPPGLKQRGELSDEQAPVPFHNFNPWTPKLKKSYILPTLQREMYKWGNETGTIIIFQFE